MSPVYASQKPSGFKNHIQNVAIVGAGGQIGSFIVAELQKKGLAVTAITRQGSSNKPAEGVQIKTVDYENHSTIVEALKGQDALIVTMAVTAPPDTQAIILKAAADAGVPWVLPNEFGMDDSDPKAGDEALIGKPKRQTRRDIEELGVSKWIAICCSFWYEYSLAGPGLYGIDIAKREVVFFDQGEVKLNTSTWPQTARAVAAVLSLPIYPKDEADESLTLSSYANNFVRVSSFALTQREMFDAVKRATGTSDTDWKISSVGARERYHDSMKRLGEGDRMAFGHAMYTRYFYPGEDAGYYEKRVGLDNQKLGLPKEDLDEFTQKSVQMAEGDYFGQSVYKRTNLK